MPRTAIPIFEMAGQVSPANAVITTIAGDSTNDHDWLLKDGDLLWAICAGGASTMTIPCTADELGRDDNIVISFGAGETRMIGPLNRLGYAQADGKIHIDLTVDTWAVGVFRNVGN